MSLHGRWSNKGPQPPVKSRKKLRREGRGGLRYRRMTALAASGWDRFADRKRPPSAALLRRLWDVIRPHRSWIALSLGLLLISSACRLALPFIVKTAIDDHLLAHSMQGYGLLAGSFLGVALLEAVCRRYQMISLERAGQNALYDLRLRVFRHLQRLPASFYDRTPIGRLVGRVTTDIESLQEMFSSGLVTILGDFVFLIAAVCILLSLSAPLTLATMTMVPLLVAVTLFVRSRVRAAYLKMRSRISQMNGVLHEQVSGMPIVQMFGQEERSAQIFGATNVGVLEAQLSTVRWESTLSAITEMLGSFTTALILWFGCSLALEGLGAAPLGTDPVTTGLTLGILFAFVDYMQKFFIPLNDLSLKFTVLQNAVVASERIFGLLDQEPEQPDPAPAARATGAGAVEFRA